MPTPNLPGMPKKKGLIGRFLDGLKANVAQPKDVNLTPSTVEQLVNNEADRPARELVSRILAGTQEQLSQVGPEQILNTFLSGGAIGNTELFPVNQNEAIRIHSLQGVFVPNTPVAGNNGAFVQYNVEGIPNVLLFFGRNWHNTDIGVVPLKPITLPFGIPLLFSRVVVGAIKLNLVYQIGKR